MSRTHRANSHLAYEKRIPAVFRPEAMDTKLQNGGWF